MGIYKYLSSTYTYTRKNKVRVKAKMRGGGDAVVGSWEDFDGTSLHFPQSGVWLCFCSANISFEAGVRIYIVRHASKEDRKI